MLARALQSINDLVSVELSEHRWHQYAAAQVARLRQPDSSVGRFYQCL